MFTLQCTYSITENELAPLKSQLEEIDLHIHEQVSPSMMCALKFNPFTTAYITSCVSRETR